MHKSDIKDYIEIDIMLILRKILAKKFLILLFIIMGVVITYAYSVIIFVPKYSVYMKLYVLNTNNEMNLNVQDVQLGNYLVKDYKEMIMSGDVIREVIKKGQLDISEKNFRKKLDVSMPLDTRVISIRYTDSDPESAYKVIQILKDEAMAQIESIINSKGIKLIETPQKPVNPDPNNMLKKYLAVILGIVLLSSFIIAVFELLNDNVNGPDDIEDVMKLPLLGVIPYRKSKATNKRRGNRHEKRRYFKK